MNDEKLKISLNLESAFHYIDHHGWSRASFGGNGAPACIAGAIIDRAESTAAAMATCGYMRSRFGMSCSGWNLDADRTEEEVLSVLISEARMLLEI